MDLLKKIEQKGFSPTQIAEKLGITRSYYYMLRKGRRSISKGLAMALYQEFKVPLEESLETKCSIKKKGG